MQFIISYSVFSAPYHCVIIPMMIGRDAGRFRKVLFMSKPSHMYWMRDNILQSGKSLFINFFWIILKLHKLWKVQIQSFVIMRRGVKQQIFYSQVDRKGGKG